MFFEQAREQAENDFRANNRDAQVLYDLLYGVLLPADTRHLPRCMPDADPFMTCASAACRRSLAGAELC